MIDDGLVLVGVVVAMVVLIVVVVECIVVAVVLTGVGCSVVEWVKRSILRWFGHIDRMGNEEFVKKVYLSSAEGMNRRGRRF